MHVDKGVITIGNLHSPHVNRLIGPFAGQAKLSPFGDRLLDAPIVGCRVDGVQLRKGDFIQRIVLVHDEDNAIGERLHCKTAS